MDMEVEYDLRAQGLKDGSGSSPIEKRISDLVRMHAHHESQCERLIEKQEELTRQIHRRGIEDGIGTRVSPQPAGGALARSNHLRTGFSEFRRRHVLACSAFSDSVPMTRRRFAVTATNSDIIEIEGIEEGIRLQRASMSSIEMEVFDCAPGNSFEAVAKLKFLTRLLLDGGEVEQDYFAYLVEECATVLEVDFANSSPTELPPKT